MMRRREVVGPRLGPRGGPCFLLLLGCRGTVGDGGGGGGGAVCLCVWVVAGLHHAEPNRPKAYAGAAICRLAVTRSS